MKKGDIVYFRENDQGYDTTVPHLVTAVDAFGNVRLDDLDDQPLFAPELFTKEKHHAQL
jgi:hypothetical protein